LNDSQSGKIVSTISIPAYDIPYINQQINSISANPIIDMMVAVGTESKDIRLLDVQNNSNKKNMIAHIPNAHADSISSVVFANNGHLFTGSHDGVLKSWDI